jgi:GT2 family glycosyltransferase
VVPITLAIATFRHDDAVLALLERAQALPFHAILVVDSLGTGRIPAEIVSRGWTRVAYHNADRNLGSAGNLQKRLELAGATGADWVYAVNHDAALEPSTFAALARVAAENPDLGAIYPLRRRPGRGGTYDLTGTHRFPLRYDGTVDRPTGLIDAWWGSSNGTLYALRPVRAGLVPWGELWMGWEDLLYGWMLAEHGYRQVIATDAVFDDPYEYKRVGPATITDKPSWYAYYFARNLLLAAQRAHLPPAIKAQLAVRIAGEFAVSATLRSRRRERLGLLATGVRDGLRGTTGKFRVP